MVKALVIIPTYNEKENIANIIEAVFSVDGRLHLLIVDDGSPDGTAAIVKSIQSDHPDQLFLIERSGKLGLGTAYITGFKWGLERNYDFLFEMDADFSHNPNDLPRLLEACQQTGVGMSVGSRYVKGGKLENWPIDRIILSYGASIYVRLITWMPVKDPTAGFVCYKKEALQKLNLDKIKFVGYGFQVEMKFAVRSLGYKIKEVPITFTDRIAGTSKMNSDIVGEAALGVLKMKWQSFFGTYARPIPTTKSQESG